MKIYNVEKLIGRHWYVCHRIQAKNLNEAKFLAFSDGISEGYRVRRAPVSEEFEPPEGHDCGMSAHIGGNLSFGTGKLDSNGFWEKPCYECARAWEQQFPEWEPCWPYTKEQLVEMGFPIEKS